MRPPVRWLPFATIVAAAVAACAFAFWPRGKVAPPEVAWPGATTADAPGAAVAQGGAPIPGPAGDGAEGQSLAPRRSAAGAEPGLSPAALALFAAAEGDRRLAVATCEVLAVGPIEAKDFLGGALLHQEVQLRVLAGEDLDHIRRYAVLHCPVCPASSEAQFGCSTPLGTLAVGQVRTFLLARGRPDLAGLSGLFADRARWVVLVGPEAARPDDPVLAAVPPQLHSYLGRARTNVFRGRVGELRQRPVAAEAAKLWGETSMLVVEVRQVAYLGGLAVLRDSVRIGQAPFTAGLDLSGIVVGGEYWFATDDATWWQVLLAFAPAR